MKSGYHQIEILEKEKQITAVTVGQLGGFFFNLTRYLLNLLVPEQHNDFHFKTWLIYEDDVIISDVCTFYLQIINLSVNIIKISRFTEYSYTFF